jgi:hypothetical protein
VGLTTGTASRHRRTCCRSRSTRRQAQVASRSGEFGLGLPPAPGSPLRSLPHGNGRSLLFLLSRGGAVLQRRHERGRLLRWSGDAARPPDGAVEGAEATPMGPPSGLGARQLVVAATKKPAGGKTGWSGTAALTIYNAPAGCSVAPSEGKFAVENLTAATGGTSGRSRSAVPAVTSVAGPREPRRPTSRHRRCAGRRRQVQQPLARRRTEELQHPPPPSSVTASAADQLVVAHPSIHQAHHFTPRPAASCRGQAPARQHRRSPSSPGTRHQP